MSTPTLDAPTLTDTDVESGMLLVIDAYYANDPHCEANHADPLNLVCSHIPVARYTTTCTRVDKKICAFAAQFVYHCLDEPNTVCDTCRNPCTECWAIHPLTT